MAEETQAQNSGQQTGQSSSQVGTQQTADAAASANTQQNTTQNSSSQQAAAKVARPDWLPEAHWDTTANSIKPEFGQHFRDLSAFKAAEDSRRLTLPAKEEDYQPKLPADFKAPDGVDFKVNDADPRLPLLRKFAKESGLTQAQFEGLIALDAAGQVSTQTQINAAKTAELAKLGANATARKTAADTWLNSVMGDDLGGEFSKFLLTAKQIEGVEKLMARFRDQGTHNFTQQHREPPQDQGKVDEETFSKMSPADRLNYVRRFPQEQFQQNNGAAR